MDCLFCYTDLYMRWGFLAGIWLLAEIAGYYGLKRLQLWRRWMSWITPLFFLLLAGLFFWGRWASLPISAYKKVQLVQGVIFLTWLALILAKLIGGLWGIGSAALSWVSPDSPSQGRRAALQILGGALMSLPAVALGYGYWRGRYRFRLQEVEILLPDLPPAWDGVSIIHFSDLHAGSFIDKGVLAPVWEKMHELKADFIVFTGDWVNIFSAELEPLVEDLRQLRAPLGKWAVLGNHDYGDYIAGASPERKQKEQAILRQLIGEAGFHLLENDAVTLEREGQCISLVGVGNWSYWRRFRRYGNLSQAWKKVPPEVFSILLSHDPTHWEYEVQGRFPIALTLSGHTHGLQFGVEWMGYQFSPAQWLYTYWAGLYQVGTQYLYVNRGLGYVGVPARFGIWPEITHIRLYSGQIHSK